MRVDHRRLGGGFLAVVLVLAAVPASASAHGLAGRAYLPVPTWLFAWAAAAVLIVSFVALSRLWSTPQLEPPARRRLVALPAAVDVVLGAVGLVVFAAVVLSGVAGNQTPAANLAPTAVFVLFWIGLPVLSVLLGDLFALLSPWRATARAARWLLRHGVRKQGWPAPLPYPEWLGRWPAVASILGFAWLELIFTGRQQPSVLAVLAVGYALVQLVGMAAFGIETWSARGDGFGTLFGLFARLSPLELGDGAVWRRRPLAGLTALEPLPGTVTLVVTMIGTTSFDGLLNGPLWRSISPGLRRGLGHLGLSGTAALEVAETAGMLLCVLICGGLFTLGTRGMSSVARRVDAASLARAFAPSLVPIAFGYLLAHYFSLLVTQGQATASLISDPLGTGSDLFGTAGTSIDYAIVSAAAIWYVQVAALVAGHVGGLALAHDRALVLFGDSQAAADSQRWMLVVMVTFTCLGLWLLSAVNT